MQRMGGSKTRKDHIENVDVWREAKDETNGILDRNDLVGTATEGRKGTIPPIRN